MKKKPVLIVFLLLLFSSLIAQTIKTRTVEIPQSGSYVKGKATFSYYEDNNGNEIKNGNYTYNFQDKGNLSGFSYTYPYLYKITVSGSFKNGEMDGLWTFTVMCDNQQMSSELFRYGTKKLTANFKNGIPEGNWSYYCNYKSKISKTHNLITELITAPENRQPDQTMAATFINGKSVGLYKGTDGIKSINITSNNNNECLSFSYQEDGVELTRIFDNGVLIKEIAKNISTGKANIQEDNSDYLSNKTLYCLRDTTEVTNFLNDFLSDEFNLVNIVSHIPEMRGPSYYNYRKIGVYELSQVKSKEDITDFPYLQYECNKSDYLINVKNKSIPKLKSDIENFKQFVAKIPQDGIFKYKYGKYYSEFRVTNIKEAIENVKECIDIATKQIQSNSDNTEKKVQFENNLKYLITSLNDEEQVYYSLESKVDKNKFENIWNVILIYRNSKLTGNLLKMVEIKNQYVMKNKDGRFDNVIENEIQRQGLLPTNDSELESMQMNIGILQWLNSTINSLATSDKLKEKNKLLKNVTDIKEIQKILKD